jgi:hypothetical protein
METESIGQLDPNEELYQVGNSREKKTEDDIGPIQVVIKMVQITADVYDIVKNTDQNDGK